MTSLTSRSDGKITPQASNQINYRAPEDLNEDKKVELPIWMAMRLNEFFRHEIPRQYNTHFQGILNADPEVVNLHKEGPKYFAMGLQVIFS